MADPNTSFMDVLSQPPAGAGQKPPSDKYTFPESAFDSPGPTKTVKKFKTLGALAIVPDPLIGNLWQVVHLPSGAFLVRGTKADMNKAMYRLAVLPVDWMNVQSDAEALQKAKGMVAPIREQFSALAEDVGSKSEA